MLAGQKLEEPEPLDLSAIACLILQDLAFAHGLCLEEVIEKITA